MDVAGVFSGGRVIVPDLEPVSSMPNLRTAVRDDNALAHDAMQELLSMLDSMLVRGRPTPAVRQSIAHRLNDDGFALLTATAEQARSNLFLACEAHQRLSNRHCIHYTGTSGHGFSIN